MSSTEGFFFSHQEIATDLIKKKGIHEGRWKLTLEVGLVATSLNAQKPDGTTSLLPAGITLIQSIGITRTEDVNNLTVDAAEVNPAPKTRKREGGRRGQKMVRK
jgi:hypothetical protein